MKVATMLRSSVLASAGAGMLCLAAGVVTGHVVAGIALAAGLLLGSANGHLVMLTLERKAPFTLASVVRLAILSAMAIGIAVLFGPSAWLVLLGVAAAQILLLVAAVREGIRP